MDKTDISERIKTLKDSFIVNKNTLDPDNLFIKYLGKSGEVNLLLKSLQTLSKEKKIAYLKELNKIKVEIEKEIQELRQHPVNTSHSIDTSMPVIPTRTGNMHPINVVSRELNQFFHYYGFSVFDGPEIETDYYNFEMMGVPKDHPARELQDTLYVMEPEILLRTQTSNVEARQLELQKPPIRFVFGGKVYRNETANRSNGSMFYQYQGVCVDKNINLGNLKWIFTKALKYILGNDTVLRFRAKYYPEVEPGLSPDFMCVFCKGKGCEVCKNRGWIEAAGGGMIHPTTLEKAGIDRKIYSGFAFGYGLDRLAMAKFGISDIRSLYNNSLIYK